MSGPHDDFFDFNHDGKLDALEWSAKMEFYDELSRDNSAQHNGTVRPWRKNRAGAGRPLQYKTGSGSGSNAAQKEKVEIDPAVWVFLKIILAAVGVLILYFAFTGIKRDMDRNDELRKVERRLEEMKSAGAAMTFGAKETSGVVCPHLWTNYPRGHFFEIIFLFQTRL